MPASYAFSQEVEQRGFTILAGVISYALAFELISALERISEADSVRKRGGIFAIRNLLDVSADVRALAQSEGIRDQVRPVLGDLFFPVRGILFDKIPDANWRVPWHQDLTIAVQERIETDGFAPWSMKSGVLHVQPPGFILENMLTVRIHLDECRANNGALRVIPGSHKRGRIAEEEIVAIREQSHEVICEVPKGGALLMRPLLLHASSPASHPSHRRVIHIDYASASLPAGLRWFSENNAEVA